MKSVVEFERQFGCREQWAYGSHSLLLSSADLLLQGQWERALLLISEMGENGR